MSSKWSPFDGPIGFSEWLGEHDDIVRAEIIDAAKGIAHASSAMREAAEAERNVWQRHANQLMSDLNEARERLNEVEEARDELASRLDDERIWWEAMREEHAEHLMLLRAASLKRLGGADV